MTYVSNLCLKEVIIFYKCCIEITKFNFFHEFKKLLAETLDWNKVLQLFERTKDSFKQYWSELHFIFQCLCHMCVSVRLDAMQTVVRLETSLFTNVMPCFLQWSVFSDDLLKSFFFTQTLFQEASEKIKIDEKFS